MKRKSYLKKLSFIALAATVITSTGLDARSDTTSGAAPAAQSAAKDAHAAVHAVAWPPYESAKTETISITKSTSQVLRFDRPVARAAISNPAVCDITPIGGQDVLVNSKEAGLANLLVWDNANNIASYTVESTINIERLESVLAAIDPSSQLTVIPFNATVAVYGTAETSLKLKQIEMAAKAFDKDAISFVQLKESKQVLLEVRFAEVNRKDNKDFKLDIEAITTFMAFRNFVGQTGASTVDSDSSYRPDHGEMTYEPIGLPSESYASFFGSYVSGSALVSNYLKWLETRNVLKIIARPNLVAKDGEQANFVVGGEFPVPISTEDRITIDYKEFGTKLKFTPEVLDDTVIRLKVDTEVSELDFSNTVTLGGIVVPSIIKRTHQTIAELKDNQSFVIGGLITQKVNKINRKVPLFGDIPLIGDALFKSSDYSRTDVELLVVITPHIVRPIQLEDKKEFYNAKEVSNAVQTMPAIVSNPDSQGDAIHNLITQNEAFFDLNGEQSEKKPESAPAAAPTGSSNKGVLPGGQAN